ncbi:PREDICTED: UDP-glycosyltransferase 89A2 [Camelina sativa]|uniref:UDP-glycosyltransferase 89A2 n=1 Tax=Camelina sativa TaxID=90675 RepID=A0ABM0V7R9_CAMSA|nr:PREDICTED: UDP-glycosyltransferase 89A2 [Camelina sativa]
MTEIMLPESRSESSKPPHLVRVVFPYPAQGHLLPLLDLTHQLCLRGVNVSVIVTPGNLTYLSPLLSAHPSSVTSIVFPFPPHPSLPPGVENVKDIGNSGNLPIMASLRQLRDPIINWFRSHPNPPIALISDFFLGWTHDLCDQISIPRFAFFSISFFLVSVLQYCFENIDRIKSTDPVHLLDLPRAPIFKEEHLPSIVRRCLQTPSPDLETMKDFSMNLLSYGSVFNSSQVLEDEYLEYVKQRTGGHDRVFVIGPLCSFGSGLNSDPGFIDPDLLSWLDGSPDGSVVYVCFGSQKALTKDQCDALALALEKSMTRFVWVVKKDPIPDGFEDRVSGRGLVVRGWVSQLAVLRHVAVGGFLSHCGWNSVLEGITSGAVILGWPMEADQFVNARLLVEHLGVAVRVCEGGETVPDSVELGRVIAETMGVRGCDVAARAEEIRRKTKVAVTEANGSSVEDLQRLVKEFGSQTLSLDVIN